MQRTSYQARLILNDISMCIRAAADTLYASPCCLIRKPCKEATKVFHRSTNFRDKRQMAVDIVNASPFDLISKIGR